MKRLRILDWDAIAGAAAAVIALVLHFLHVADERLLIAVVLVILAIMLIRDLRRESREEIAMESLVRTETEILKVRSTLSPSDIILIGPRGLRTESVRFARQARGEMTWFNVCLLMFVPQSLFDVLLRPAIENPAVTAIQFILDDTERERWQRFVLPKIGTCTGSEKVREPRWCVLKESVSFIISEVEPEGKMEAQLSFWGEPFMSRTTGREIPRYIFRVQAHSELIPRLIELEREYRLGTRLKD